MMIYPACLAGIYDHPSIHDKDMNTIYGVHEKVFFKKGDFILKEVQNNDP